MSRIVRWAANVLLAAAAIIVAATIVLPAALGLQRYVITGGSMTGAIDKGSAVFARIVPVESLMAGDIITFAPPGDTTPVTHRILSVSEGPDGERVFQTKGDFNEAADPWRLIFTQPSAARYVCHVPYLGYLLAALSVREIRVLVIALPALLIAVSLLGSVWRTAGEEMRKHEIALSDLPGGSVPADEEAGA
jgi:signal peptidase